MREKLRMVVLVVLASPLILLYSIQHLYEETIIFSSRYSDWLFMKRFSLIDNNHVEDFIDWNEKYCASRVIDPGFRCPS